MEILKNFIHSLNYLQIIGLALYIVINIWLIKFIFNIYIDFEGFKVATFLMAMAIMAFSFDFSNGKLNIISVSVMLGITILIYSVSVAVLTIHLKIKKKELGNDEVE